MPVLDLSGADTTGFDPIPTSVYFAEVFEAKMEETKGGEQAKLPKGTNQINVQFKILGKPGETDGEDEKYEYYNRRVFRRYNIPPAKDAQGNKYDPGKAAKMKGMLVRFLEDVGFTREEMESKEFDLDLEDLKERRCRVSVSVRPATVDDNGVEIYAASNDVKGTKPWEGSQEPAGLLT